MSSISPPTGPNLSPDPAGASPALAAAPHRRQNGPPANYPRLHRRHDN